MALLLTIIQVWTIIFILLKLTQYVTNNQLAAFLTSRNIKLRFCFISFYTTRFNALIESHARRRKTFLSYWFSFGVLFGIIGLLLSLLLLSANAYFTLVNAFKPIPLSNRPITPAEASQLPNIPPREPLRGPAARIPFMHKSSKPWWVPASYWYRISPRDHAAWHANTLLPHKRHGHLPDQLPQTRRFVVPYDQVLQSNGKRHDERLQPASQLREGRSMSEGRPLTPSYRQKKRAHRHYVMHRLRTLWNGVEAALFESERGLFLQGVRRIVNRKWGTDGDKTNFDEETGRTGSGAKSQLITTPRRKLLSVKEVIGGGRHAVDELPYVRRGLKTAQSEREVGQVARSGGMQHATFSRTSFLTPLVPGVTVPPGDLWYMIVAALTAAVVHELGHALAATVQNAKVSGVGGFMALALPGAYVQLTGIEELAPFAQLRVYCAGPWHNLVLAIFALILVSWLPLVCSAFFTVGTGALVVSLPKGSPLRGHVEVGDIVLSLGKFKVEDGGPSFRRAVSDLTLTNDTVGFCIPEDMYRNYSKPVSTCCADEYLENAELSASLPYKCFRVQGIEKRKSCIHPAVVSTQPTCRLNVDCSRSGTVNGNSRVASSKSGAGKSGLGTDLQAVGRASKKHTDADAKLRGKPGATGKATRGRKDQERTSCFLPVLPLQQQLIDIRVRKARSGDVLHFFYEGYAYVLGQSMTVSSYVPRLWLAMPSSLIHVLALADLPNMIERLLQYLSSISMALAILNMAPVFFLDGEMSSVLLVRLFVPKISSGNLAQAKQIIVGTGTVLLVINILGTLLDVEGWS